jgi:hypothetical protein
MHRSRPSLPVLAACGVTVLCAAAWTRSCFRRDSLAFDAGGRGYIVCSLRGRIGAVERSFTFDEPRARCESYRVANAPGGAIAVAEEQPGSRRFLGLCAGAGTMPWSGRARWLIVPYWAPAAGAWAAMIPLAVLHRLRRRRLARAGRCIRCGYDLRASPGRCPECGASAAAAATGEPKDVPPVDPLAT